MIRLVLFAAIATWPAIVLAAGSDARWLAASAAAVFAISTLMLASVINAGSLRSGDPASRERVVARENAGVVACVFTWGAGAFALGYGLTPLHWQHWWQYALVMALLAGAMSAYRWRLGLPESVWARKPALAIMAALTVATGVAAIVGLAVLVASDKFWRTDKPDWLANHIFIAGGGAFAAVAFIAAWSQRRARRLAQAAAEAAPAGSKA